MKRSASPARAPVASVTRRAARAAGSPPLAARIEPVDFVLVGFGLAVSPLDEDREAIAFDMERQGYGPEVLAKAMEIADATAAVVLSGFREGYDGIDAVKAKYGKEPWFRHVHGNITFFLLQTPEATLREQGPLLAPGIPLQYDPMPVLRNLDAPQLWILGADDTDAPVGETSRRLAALAGAGRPIRTAVFPRADHGIYEYETRPDGTRVSTRNANGYFALMRDFILDRRLRPTYGSSRFLDAKGADRPARAATPRPDARSAAGNAFTEESVAVVASRRETAFSARGRPSRLASDRRPPRISPCVPCLPPSPSWPVPHWPTARTTAMLPTRSISR